MSSLLENIDCKLEKCGDIIPVNDGDCCAGINDDGDCVKGKWDAENGVCVVKTGISTKRALEFIGIVLFIIFILWALVRIFSR